MSKLFTENRQKFAAEMKNNSLMVIYSGEAPAKRGDEFYPFTPQRNFYYLTGIDVPSLIFSMHKDGAGNVKETLYLQRFDPVEARWSGAVLDEFAAAEMSGIKNFAFIDEFEAKLPPLFNRYGVETVYIDMENRSMEAPVSPDLRLAKGIAERFPFIKIENAYPIFADLRVIKSEGEIERMRKAIDITHEGLLEMMRNTKPGMMEYEVEAHFEYIIKKYGCRDRAFATILGAGPNGTVLHYGENNCQIEDGDLVLIDFGAQWQWYSADVTRTYPANGRFTDRQRQIYDIVLGANELIISMIKPGIPFKSLNEATIKYYQEKLQEIGLIAGADEVSEYYFHGVSHMLGLETHDIGRGAEGVLAPGMVLTVEPGLYIAEEGIGIRIEDDVLVTENGCEVLTKDILKTADEIEAFMAAR